jgi:hypothetical protein
MARRRDSHTLDMFQDYEPPVVAVRYDDSAPVQASSVDQTIARAVSQTLKEDGRSRGEIAEAMTAYLGAECSENMLNAYASAARDSHRISLERAAALVAVTGDARLIGQILAPLDLAVIPERYLGAIDEAVAAEREEAWARRRKQARRSWTGGVRR